MGIDDSEHSKWLGELIFRSHWALKIFSVSFEFAALNDDKYYLMQLCHASGMTKLRFELMREVGLST